MHFSSSTLLSTYAAINGHQKGTLTIESGFSPGTYPGNLNNHKLQFQVTMTGQDIKEIIQVCLESSGEP